MDSEGPWHVAQNAVRSLFVGAFILGASMPFIYALHRLNQVTEWTVFEAVYNFNTVNGATEALRFTLIEALASALLTILLGLPVAWSLSRYKWKRIRLIRAFLAVPFVTPSIVAAMGFLSLIRDGGILARWGIDLRLETGIVGDFARLSGWNHPGHFAALILAHAWFNLSLMIRFVEPTLATLDPAWEEQLTVLPDGKSKWKRIRSLWAPVLGPAIMCAGALSFLFSFTSFALVKWLSPNNNTLESLMAEAGSSAGIVGYRIDSSELIYSVALVQFCILLMTLAVTSAFQKRYVNRLSLLSEYGVRDHNGEPSQPARITVILALAFTSLPFISTVISSLQVRKINQGELQHEWSLQGWKNAWAGDVSNIGVNEAMTNSIVYALATLIIALPLGWILASTIHRLSVHGWSKTARSLDLICMLPLATSALMVGLGVLLGGLRWYPEMFNWYLLPVYPHVLLTVPFVVRVMLPAYGALDPMYAEQCRMLNISPLKTWYHGTLMFLRGPAVVAASLTLAFSLGEFGASWLLVRAGSWDTLSIVVDQLMGRPMFDPTVYPTAMAAATMLMALTFVLFVIAERFRESSDRSGF